MVSSPVARSSPIKRIGISKLTRMAFAGERMDRLSSQLLIESMKSSENSGILMDLATVEQLRGNTRAGLEFQSAALKQSRAFTTQNEAGEVLRLLVLSAPIEIGGNTPVEFLLENSNINMINYYVDLECNKMTDFPDFDQIFVAAPGDDSVNNPYIQHIGQIITENGLQVINSPDQIMKLDRDMLPELLSDIPKTAVPPIMRISRSDLLGEFSNCKDLSQFEKLTSEPFVIRPTASHAGKGLELLQNMAELTAYTAKHVSDEYFISRFVDYRSGDGNFRKYRIIFIDGRAYPYHLAIGDSWKLWYMNAHMGACRKKLAEEADFLKSFEQYFAVQHAEALNCISERVGLEYFGIDCGVTKTGDLLVFEADNALIVHDMDAVGDFSYKQEAMANLFTAFEAMIIGGSSKISSTEHPGRDSLINTVPYSLS